MMSPPKIAHQRIASNIERALNTAIETFGLSRRADREIGLQIEAAPGYRPEPEVAVIDADYEHERYASRFYGVVEVLSATDLACNPRSDKLLFYRSHASAEFILVVSQDEMRLEVYRRGADGAWLLPITIGEPDEVLVLPRLGTVCTLAGMYKGVRLLDNEA